MSSSRVNLRIALLPLAAAILLAFGPLCLAQIQTNQGQTNQVQTNANPANPPAKTAPPPANPAPPKDDEVKITPQQAKDLFHSVDEILQFDSRQTGLPIKHEVKRRLTSRDQVVAYLTKHMNDEDVQRLRRSELVLKKFGLLPRDFDLETFLLAILREEIAGYYDPKTKTVNLLDWVPLPEQEPVMAHELTHALQDQTIGLQKWMKKGDRDLAEMHRDPTPADIENDEIDNVREAVVEGQAQAMMLQYAIAPTGHTLTDSPDLIESMVAETTTGSSETKVFNQAPIFMKESLTFPYSYGMEFIVKLLAKQGKSKAFAGVLENPPHTTRQIMQPETYLAGEKIEPMPVPDFKRDFKDYKKFDIGAIGEFDVAVLIEQYAGKPASKHLYPEWRGGYYYAVMPRPGADQHPASNPPLALLYVSRWSSADKAGEFADIYARALKQRYQKLEAVGDSLRDPRQESPSQENGKDSQELKIKPLMGRHSWNTEEGAVVIEEQGDMVFISENLDAATTATVEKELLPK